MHVKQHFCSFQLTYNTIDLRFLNYYSMRILYTHKPVFTRKAWFRMILEIFRIKFSLWHFLDWVCQNIMPKGQNQLCQRQRLHSGPLAVLENVNKGTKYLTFNCIFTFLQLFLLINTSTVTIHTTLKQLIDKPLNDTKFVFSPCTKNARFLYSLLENPSINKKLQFLIK